MAAGTNIHKTMLVIVDDIVDEPPTSESICLAGVQTIWATIMLPRKIIFFQIKSSINIIAYF